MQFCLPLFLFHSIHMLTRLFCVNALWKDCESKSNLSAFFKKGNSNTDLKLWIDPVQIKSRLPGALSSDSVQKNPSNHEGSMFFFAWGKMMYLLYLAFKASETNGIIY